MLKANVLPLRSLVRPWGAIVLGSVLAIPAMAQTSAAPAQPAATAASTPAREGFWGRVNPFARKKWVDKRVDPLRDRLNELDEVNARNAGEIRDVDARAQAGIGKAQATADSAGALAKVAGQQADQANASALAAGRHSDQIGQTVGGLDQYKSVREMDLLFHGADGKLTPEARQQLDELAAGVQGRQGYLIEIEGRAHGAGQLGMRNSVRLNEAVERYLAGNGQIPVYRLHAVALGDVPADGHEVKMAKGNKPSSVHLRVLENSLAVR